MILPRKLEKELGEPGRSFFLLFIVFSKYLLSVCLVHGPVLGWRYRVGSLQSRG